MTLKKALLAMVSASALAAIAIPALADGYEIVPPAPGPGYVWKQGHWNWNGYRNVWVAGYWALRGDRPPAYVAPPSQLAYVPWGDRDNDGDGVPNSIDRFPNDPYQT